MKHIIQNSIILGCLSLMACGEDKEIVASNALGTPESATPATTVNIPATLQPEDLATKGVEATQLKKIVSKYSIAVTSETDDTKASHRFRQNIEMEIRDTQLIVRLIVPGCDIEETHRISGLNEKYIRLSYEKTNYIDTDPETTCNWVQERINTIPRLFPEPTTLLKYEIKNSNLKITEGLSTILLERQEVSPATQPE